jgi:hypothetical protein
MAWLALYSPDAEIPRAVAFRVTSPRVKAEVIKRHKALREDVNLGPRKVAVVAVASTSS